MFTQLLAILPLLTLASAGTLQPSVKIAFTYAIADGQPDQTTFTPLPVELPELGYKETEEEVKGDQDEYMNKFKDVNNIRGVLNFDSNDYPKSFMWSRDTSKYKERKCNVEITGHPHPPNNDQLVIWDIKKAVASPATDDVRKHVHVECEPIPQ